MRLQEMLVLFPCSRRRGGAIFDKYSSDTCKAARDVCGFVGPTAARLRDRVILRAKAASCTYLNYRWIRPFSWRTQGSPGWRPAGSYARTAGLRLFFSTAANEERAEANWSGSARRVRLSK